VEGYGEEYEALGCCRGMHIPHDIFVLGDVTLSCYLMREARILHMQPLRTMLSLNGCSELLPYASVSYARCVAIEKRC